jgi:cell division protein FtsL
MRSPPFFYCMLALKVEKAALPDASRIASIAHAKR